jgi:hypothetical protein
METNIDKAAPAVDAAELGKLKALAEAATQGPWEWEIAGEESLDMAVLRGANNVRVCDFGVGDNHDPAEGTEPDAADMAFMAAANPAAILRIAALVAQLESDAEKHMDQLVEASEAVGAEAAEVKRLESLVAQQAARIAELEARERTWVPVVARLPEVKPNDYEQFIVAVKRGSNAKTYVFAAYYLNALMLLIDDDDCPEDGLPFTGWHDLKCDDPDYDDAWVPLIDASSGDEVTHWQALPVQPTATKEGK